MPSPGCNSPKQVAILAISTAYCFAAEPETAASGALPQHAAAGNPAAHSFEDISIKYPLAGGKGEREARVPAQPSMQELEAELLRLLAEVADERRIKELDRKAEMLRVEIAANLRSHAAGAAPNSRSLHLAAAIQAAGGTFETPEPQTHSESRCGGRNLIYTSENAFPAIQTEHTLVTDTSSPPLTRNNTCSIEPDNETRRNIESTIK